MKEVDVEKWPTVGKLVAALEAQKAPRSMIEKAKQGAYHDYLSKSGTPVRDLAFDALCHNVPFIPLQAVEGEYDATDEEGELWMAELAAGVSDDYADIMEDWDDDESHRK